METFYNANSGLLQRSSIALGFFDGVHPGHQVVIGAAVKAAKQQNLTAAVVTFKDHPRTLIQGSSPLLLTAIDQRLALFEKLGVEAVLVLTFTEELCRLTPAQYVQNILVDSMGAKSISVGFNHHFGRDREGNPTLLADLGQAMGFSLTVSPPIFVDGLEVSSSKIREALLSGQIELANKMLSRPYAAAGDVVEGAKRGRTIGIPTANLLTEQYQVIPAKGVYAGKVELRDDRILPAVINVGVRPTFDGGKETGTSKPLIEAHIFDFDQDIYGHRLEVQFHQYLREERKFDSPATLKTQILADCQQARHYFDTKTTGQQRAATKEPEQKLPA